MTAMATVRMKIQITGARNLEPWPAPGELIEVPDHEAVDLIVAGYAEEVPDATQPADDSDSDTVGDDDSEATQAGTEATTGDETATDDSDNDAAGEQNTEANRSVPDDTAARGNDEAVDQPEAAVNATQPKPSGRRSRKS